ncbi:TolA-binding protein [Desulfitispora alkaliphila]|uniref:hypothetical protein n=1 Tax=Desulfitispora alkaliphila TaxID=622674 RepID=UPI003D24E3BE
MEEKDNLSRLKQKKEEKSSTLKQVGGTALLLALAISLFFGGYTYFEERLEAVQKETEASIEQALMDVQETNSLTVQNLEGKLDNLLLEMEEIKIALSEADENLGSSSAVQESMSQRIEELDNQLKELQQGLILLQEDFHESN